MRRIQGKTIRLFLVDGSPLGLVTAEIINWTGQVLSFPRGLLPDALKRKEVMRTGVYFLIGVDPDDPLCKRVYIGKSDDIAQRLRTHDSDPSKEFHDHIVIFVSKDENLTTGHVNFLEHHLISRVRSVGTATLVNGNQGCAVTLPESEISDMEYAFEQLCVLMSALGFTFLQEVPKHDAQHSNGKASPGVMFELSYLNGSIKATAYESEGRMVVRKGSTARHPSKAADCVVKGTTTRNYPFYSRTIQELQIQKKLVPKSGSPDLLVFSEDVMFTSPSAASDIICGSSTNGRNFWKVQGTAKTYGEWRKEQLDE
ncbi:MAG: GIY-YIG nuclease family protein [Candidatus Melainabacteria bacterium]|nr:MAG: GIY-YIG nuclease family protein [Candidatus Melainabacteria bacterium]